MMRIIKTFVLLIIFFGISSRVNAGDNMFSENDSIHTIRIQSLSPLVTEHEKYDFTMDKDSEIKYITHFLDSLEVSEGKVPTITDDNSLLIEFIFTDNSRTWITVNYYGISISGIYNNGIMKDEMKEYVFLNQYQGYIQITELMNALKFRNFVIPDNLSFSPSSWAKSEVDFAMKNGYLRKK